MLLLWLQTTQSGIQSWPCIHSSSLQLVGSELCDFIPMGPSQFSLYVSAEGNSGQWARALTYGTEETWHGPSKSRTTTNATSLSQEVSCPWVCAGICETSPDSKERQNGSLRWLNLLIVLSFQASLWCYLNKSSCPVLIPEYSLYSHKSLLLAGSLHLSFPTPHSSSLFPHPTNIKWMVLISWSITL